MKLDRVLTINDYYDGPRLGIAELRGVPHIYDAEFDHDTDYSGDTYFLTPIDPKLLALAMEDWAICVGGVQPTAAAKLATKHTSYCQTIA